MEELRSLGCCFPVKVDRSIRSYSSSTLSKCSSSKRSWRRLSLRLRDSVNDNKNSPVVCFGEILVDFLPNDSGVSLADASGFKIAPGGAPANVAVAIARLGGHSAFIGKVGEDEFGYMLADVLKNNNVDNSGLCFDPNARTALSFVTLKPDGAREFMFYRNPSADMLLKESELDEPLVRKGSIFHYGSISLIDEPCKTAHLSAMDIAKNAGCLLSYDPNLRVALWPSPEYARKSIMDIWELADVIKVSDEEVKFLLQSDDPIDDEVVVKRLFHSNLKLLLVTEGSKGCRYYTQMFQGSVPGIKVETVDSTGAGDAFMGGFLKKLTVDRNLYRHERKLKDAVTFANACGAITVTKKGAIPALPTKQAVLEILSRGNC